MKQEKAFTLAEVLITLTIIGVIAALTIPTLMQKHNRHVVETKLTKVYSTLYNALKMSQAENGSWEEWPIDTTSDGAADKSLTDRYILPYVKTAKNSNNANDANELNYDVFNPKTKTKLWKFNARYNNQKRNTSFCLDDGVCILIEGVDGLSRKTGVLSAGTDTGKPYEGRVFHFYVDTNGPKKPNMLGKDIFRFYVFKDLDNGGLYFAPMDQKKGLEQSYIDTYENKCRTGTDPDCCTTLIFKNGVFKFPDNYPWL